jgi:hypothetical protein
LLAVQAQVTGLVESMTVQQRAMMVIPEQSRCFNDVLWCLMAFCSSFTFTGKVLGSGMPNTLLGGVSVLAGLKLRTTLRPKMTAEKPTAHVLKYKALAQQQ